MMKKMLGAAAALLALFGLIACGSPTASKTEDAAAGTWKIKGSFDGWVEHSLTADELDANSLSYEVSGLYQDSNFALVYEFVLINPSGTEFKASGANETVTTVTTEADAVFGDSGASGSTHKANAGFTAATSSYTISVDISSATAPSVSLTAGAAAAPVVTDAVLLQLLKIKGDQFSSINETVVANWTAADGTVSGSTESWDVLVDNKTGQFGFDSINGFLAKVAIDASGLAAEGDASDSVELLNAGGTGVNSTLSGPTMDGSVYTIAVTVDATKAVNDGRYTMTATLKTLSTEDWAYEVPSFVYVTGDITSQGWKANLADNTKITVTNKVATYEYTVAEDKTDVSYWKISDGALDGWGGQLKNDRMDFSTSSIAQADDTNDTPNFTLEAGKTYTFTFDFSSATYAEDGKVIATVTLNS